MMNHIVFLLKSIQAAIEAGDAILEVYYSDFKVEKKTDRSPLTLADKRSHEIIVKRLSQFDVPILSEEGKSIPYEVRQKWNTFWLVDPLDGTKEFIKKNGEFTVNIAMIEKQNPITGVICVPDKDTLYFAANKIGSFEIAVGQIAELLKDETTHRDGDRLLNEIMRISTKLPTSDAIIKPFTIIGSRSHATPELEAYVAQKRRQYDTVDFISAGSSLKFCRIAAGQAHVYPRLGPTMEWDTAAGQAIVESAGGQVIRYASKEPLIYNKENLLNPWFVVSR